MTEVGHRLHHPAGAIAQDGCAVVVNPSLAKWSYSGLRILDLAGGEQRIVSTGPDEVLVVPLSGSVMIECEGERLSLAGRTSVFSGPTDFAYLPCGSEAVLVSSEGGRFALPSARTQRRLPLRYGPVQSVPVELRGAGNCSRQVNNFCTPEAFETDRLIACEVLTPGGNWSSYPPHKHDEERPGESVLEEIYYFEVADGPGGPGMAYQQVYGTPERPINLLAQVRTGDVVLVPHGWHGPSIAAPGFDLYYLNVMAGPGAERAWLISDDPAYAWVRGLWSGLEVDSRLPFDGASRSADHDAEDEG